MTAIAAIPAPNVLEFKPKLRHGVSYIQGRFELLCTRIFYLDGLFLGHRESDPFDSIDWRNYAVERRILELKADLAWAKLQVINHGFDLIREAALADGHEFNFQSPRELFAQILKEQRDHELEPIIANSIAPNGATLKEERQIGALQSKFYRGRFETAREELEFLEFCRKQLWSGFWIYAIWSHRHRGGQWEELRNSWKRFLKAHKALLEFLNSPTVRANGASTLQWSQGAAISSATKRAVKPDPKPIRYEFVTKS